MTAGSPSIEDFAKRLLSSEPVVRRIAIADLVRASGSNPAATEALAGHLASEKDEKAAIAIIRHLGAARHEASQPRLWAMYIDTATPGPVAHAAILSHDAIELHRGGGSLQ